MDLILPHPPKHAPPPPPRNKRTIAKLASGEDELQATRILDRDATPCPPPPPHSGNRMVPELANVGAGRQMKCMPDEDLVCSPPPPPPRPPPPPPPLPPCKRNRTNVRLASGEYEEETTSILDREAMPCPPPPPTLRRGNRTVSKLADGGGGRQAMGIPNEGLVCPPSPPPPPRCKKNQTIVRLASGDDGPWSEGIFDVGDTVYLPPPPLASKGKRTIPDLTNRDDGFDTTSTFYGEDTSCPTPPPAPHQSGDTGVESMNILDKEDMAFICGKRGTTVRKIGRTSGCKVELFNDTMQMEVRGTPQQRHRALKYARFMIAQRKAKKEAVPVHSSDISDDCTIVDIPKDAMKYVLGNGGATLRIMEQENDVIMFVCHVIGRWFFNDVESLCILGDRSSRRNAQLEVMSSVESQAPGYYISQLQEHGEMFEQQSDCSGDWGTSTKGITEAEKSFLIGPGGRTRKSLAKASNCVVQLVSTIVFLSGTTEQRSRAKDYVFLTLSQISDEFTPHAKKVFLEDRDDRTILEIPSKDVGYIAGKGRETFNVLEEQFGVLMVFCDTLDFYTYEESSGTKKLAIFGPLRCRTYAEVEVMSSVEANNPGACTAGHEAKRSVVKGVAIDSFPIDDPRKVGYIIGKDGNTLTRLSKASGAFVQFVGHILHIAGDFDERSRARDYVGFHMQIEKHNYQPHVSVSGRSDLTIVITDGLNLVGPDVWKIESESGTFCMNALDDEGVQQFFIFGADEGDPDAPWHIISGRARAEKMAIALVRAKRKQLRMEKERHGLPTGNLKITQAREVHVRHSPF